MHAHGDLIDRDSAPFDQYSSVHRLAPDRSGHYSVHHGRHLLYTGRDKRSRAHVLIKLTSKPGLVYEHDLINATATLSTINRELPASPYFPVLVEHGRLRDGRVYMTMSLFDELPLATTIGTERMPAKMVGHVRTAIEVAKALAELHRLGVFHVDLNPMNILYRSEKSRPVIRIVDFESSYELARHSKGVFYNPPTTDGYSAPEVTRRGPDGRSDVFSLGAVLYTMLASYQWTWKADVATCVDADDELEPELKRILRSAVDPIPDGRYPSMQDFHDVLAAYLEGIWPGRSW